MSCHSCLLPLRPRVALGRAPLRRSALKSVHWTDLTGKPVGPHLLANVGAGSNIEAIKQYIERNNRAAPGIENPIPRDRFRNW